MSNKYTEQEVLDKASELTSKPTVLNRRQSTTAEDVVTGLIDLTYRSLNSDIDSVYDLVRIHVNDQVVLCTEVLAGLSEMYDLVTTLHIDDEGLDEEQLRSVRAAAEVALFSSGEERSIAINSLRSRISRFVKSGHSGKSPQFAKARSLELLVEMFGLVGVLGERSRVFAGIVSDYMSAPFENVSMSNQMELVNKALTTISTGMSDPSEAKLILAVADTLIENKFSSKRDIRLPKYAGPVTTMPDGTALLRGATTPLIIQEESQTTIHDVPRKATISVSGGTTESVVELEAPVSARPSVAANMADSAFDKADGGYLISPVVDYSAGPIAISSHDLYNGASYLSDEHHTSSYDDSTTSSTAFCPFLKTCVTSGTVSITVSTIYRTTPSFSYWQPSDFILDSFVLTDDSSGTLRDQGGIAWGSIDHSTGALYIVSPDGHDIDLHAGVAVTYRYNPLKEARSYVASPGDKVSDSQGFVSWDSFTIWSGNIAETFEVDTELSSVENFVNTVDSKADYYDSVIDGSAVAFSSKLAGSASRTRFPNRAGVVKNPAAFAPVWTTTPTDLNEALGLISSLHQESFGKDTLTSTIEKTGEELFLKVSKSTLLRGESAQWLSSNKLLMGDSSDVLLPGDNLRVTAPISCDVKVVSVTDGLITVRPDVPVSIKDGYSDEVDPSPGITVNATRDVLVAESVSDDALIALTASYEGLGFSGSGTSSSTSIYLGQSVDLDGVSTLPGYTIKPGDVVIEVGGDIKKPIGSVAAVNGPVITIGNLADEFIYPFNNIEIYALGWSKFSSCSDLIRPLSASLGEQIFSSDFIVNGSTFINSGSGQGNYFKTLLGMTDMVGKLRDAYLLYDAHSVNTVRSLLNHFKQDKLSTFSNLLKLCDFRSIADMTPSSFSDQASVEQLMEEASIMLGGDLESLEEGQGISTTNDYLSESNHIQHSGNSLIFSDAEEP